jgi:hypothetical protein
MLEVIREAFAAVNLPFTLLFLLMLFYWCSAILGGFGLEGDAGADAGTHARTGAGGNADSGVGPAAGAHGGGPRAVMAVLRFFHLGDLPAMVLASIVIITLWLCVMLGNRYFNPAKSWLPALPVTAGALGVTLVVLKLTGMPLARAYRALNRARGAPTRPHA